jgi:hypothetical protein
MLFLLDSRKISHRHDVCNYWQIIFKAEFASIFMISFRTKLHKPSSNVSFVIDIKQKAKYKCHAAAI